MKRFFSIFSILLVLLSIFSVGATAYSVDETLRIGLYYGSNALPTANLQNYVGSGYKLGFWDSSKNFKSLGETEETKISVLKDKNIYLGGDGLYYDTMVSSTKDTIGAYHLEISENYSSYSSAKSVASKIDGAFPAYINGTYKVRIGSYTTKDKADQDITRIKQLTGYSTQSVGGSETCYTVTITNTDTIIFEYDNNSNIFGIMPTGSNTQTWFKGYKYYGGFAYNRLNGNDITVVNYVGIDDYIKGVVPYEVSPSWHIEALKAQAVCARSYAYNSLNKHKSNGFDLCNTTDCQVYKGTNSANSNSDKAVDQTTGQYITHSGKIATGFFHSSNGGATENSENVWSSKVEYLRGVKDIHENGSAIKDYNWTTTVSGSTIASILKEKGYNVSGVSDMYVDQFTNMGNVYRLTIVDSTGKKYDFEKEKARTILNSTKYNVTVKSMRYTVNGASNGNDSNTGTNSYYVNGTPLSTEVSLNAIGSGGTKSLSSLTGKTAVTGNGSQILSISDTKTVAKTANDSYTITGTGWGHNVGMSQYGAKSMAEKGYSYSDILKFYFTGVSISSAS